MVGTFSIVTIVTIAVQTIALIALHLLPTGYDPKADAVSDYGIEDYPTREWRVDPRLTARRPLSVQPTDDF
jgi:hypothetical protein